MGVSDLREAFNQVASPRFTASMAFLTTEREAGIEWSRLIFSGIGGDSLAFEIASDRIPAGGDVIEAAKATAKKLIDKPSGAA